MKGEYVEQHSNPNKGNETPPPSLLFSKLHQSQSQSQNNPFHPFQLSHHECQPIGEDDNHNNNSGGATAQKPNSSGDGASIEVARRPRGRPPGSKNKPKPPIIITRDPETVMSPFILEVSGGNDVVEAISEFSRRKNIGLCVLTGSGTVANVTLRQPSTTPGTTVTFHGRFDILSITATFLPQQPGVTPAIPSNFSISLAGPQGQIVGGIVAGNLIAAGTVFVIASSFNNPSYHRLPLEEDEGGNSVSGGGGDGTSQNVSGAVDSGQGQGGGESCGMSMYSCHLPSSDVIWATSARPPPPY